MEPKKRLLFFVPHFPVISETFIEREIAKIAERGVFDVKVFALKKGYGHLSDVLKDKIIYHRLSIFDCIRGIPLIFRKRKRIAKAFSLVSRPYIFIKSLGYASFIHRQKPDFIIAHFLSIPSTIAMIVSNVLDIPYGISAHAKDITVESEFVKQKSQTSKFILICNKNAYKFATGLCEKECLNNIYLQYHGLDFEKFLKKTNAVKPVESKNKMVLLFVGRFVEKKGLRYLIDAARILKDRRNDFKLHIVGGGPLHNDLKNQVKFVDVSDMVKIIGNNKGTPFEEVLRYYKSADIFIFPGIRTASGDEDGLANVIVEASALKIPVVATAVGSTQDLIVDNETGIIVPQRASEALAMGIEMIMKNEDLGKKLAQQAHKKARSILDLNKNVVEIENLILRNL